MRRSRGWFLWLAGSLWLAIVVAGFASLLIYKSTPGRPAAPPATWPTGSALPPPADRPLLVMFVHPKCTCSRASLAELARLMDRAPERPRAEVVFWLPEGTDANWGQTDLLKAASLAGAQVYRDFGGKETDRFAAETSGATLLYGADGKLLFSGGLTQARGHEGDSFGQERVLALLAHRVPDRHDSPVFGCPFHSQDEGSAQP